MKSFNPGSRAAVLAAFLWFGINLLLLPRFPTVYIDEAENANHAYNLAVHHQALFSLYDGLYPPAMSELRYAWPVVIRPFYCYPLAAWFKLAGFSLVKGRLFSLFAGFFALLAVYAAGCLIWNRRLGYFAMAILGTRFVFLYTADRIRPEMWLCLCGLLAFIAALLSVQSRRPWFAAASGLLAGLAAGLHTNGIVLILPVAAFLTINRKWPALGLCFLGAFAGIVAFISAADWAHFLPGTHALFFQEFSSPSILKFHGNILAAIGSEFDRYFSGWDFYDWSGGKLFHILNGWHYLFCAAAVAWGCTRKDALRIPAQFAAVLALGYALVVGQKAFPYISVLEPYFALALAGWLLSAARPSWPSIGVSLGLLLTAFPLGKIPAMLVVPLKILPRRPMRWAMLILLGCVFMRASELAGWGLQFVQDVGLYWPVSAAGSALFLAIAFYKRGRLPDLEFEGFAWAGLGLTTLGTLVFVASIAAYQPSFGTLCRRIARQMRPGARVAGPQALWLGLSDYDYRDIGGLGWYRLLLGEKDLTRPLKLLKPDYMIVDASLVNKIARLNRLRRAKDLQPPTMLFPWRHQVIYAAEVGPAYGGQMAVIENDWTPPGKKR
jgi:hypothetical protein